MLRLLDSPPLGPCDPDALVIDRANRFLHDVNIAVMNIVSLQKLPLNDFSRDKIDKSVAELKEEKSEVSDLLGK